MGTTSKKKRTTWTFQPDEEVSRLASIFEDLPHGERSRAINEALRTALPKILNALQEKRRQSREIDEAIRQSRSRYPKHRDQTSSLNEPLSEPKSNDPNLNEAAEAAHISTLAEASGLHRDPGSQRTPATAAPNVRKGKPSAAASKPTKDKPAPPGKAPK